MMTKRRIATLPVAVCGTILALAPLSLAQARATFQGQQPDAGSATPAKDDAPALPAGLVPAPAGTMTIGRTPEQLVAMEEKLFFSAQQRLRDIKLRLSELGVRKNVPVAPFYMGRHPVTNAEYKAFVEATGHRFPFHWWRDGRKDDFEQRLPEINKLEGDVAAKTLSFWLKNWKELPWAIPQDQVRRGESVPMDDYPVTWVSWEDAVAYAAWAGMRLPTEVEWIYAATGGTDKEFVWGDDYDQLPVERSPRNDRLWEVGKWGDKLAGPFGHRDMALGVWEWTGDLGFFPHVPNEDWTKLRKDLLREKMFRKDEDPDVRAVHDYFPTWRGNMAVCKGGFFGETIKPNLRVQTRAPMETLQTLEYLGFRVAKSQRPGLDVAVSSVRVGYDRSYFGGTIEPNLADQIGIERYELAGENNEKLAGYHAVSFVPVNHASEEKIAPAKLLESTIEDNRPVVMGTLIVTGKLQSPEIGPGVYTLTYRQGGKPAALDKALGLAAKAAKSGDAEAADGDWSKTLRKYAITIDDVKAGPVNFVRLNPGGLQVPTANSHWVLRDADGNYVHAFEATGTPESKAGYENGDATIEVEKRPEGHERVTIEFGVPKDPKAKGSVYFARLVLEIPQEWTGGERWLLPPPKAR